MLTHPSPTPEWPLGLPAMDRSLPPALSLIKGLASLDTLDPALRPSLARQLLGHCDPLPDEDRPVFKEWLAQWVERRLLDGPLPALVHEGERRRQAEADALHRTMVRHSGFPGRQRRLLEQELLLRSALPEDWHFHRAKWRYLELQADQAGNLLAPGEAARRARQAEVFFHPDQLRPSRNLRWFGLRQAVELLDGRAWLQLLDALCAGKPVDLALAPDLWPHLRPWIKHLLGGQGLGFMELTLDGLPAQPGQAPSRRGLLILHEAEDSHVELERWCRDCAASGWQVLVVQDPARAPLEWANRVVAGPASVRWAQRHRLSMPALEGRPLPLRDFLRSVERHYILDVLGVTGGIKTRACECLGISRQTLYAKLAGDEAGA